MFFFLPYATDRPRRRVPYVTYALVLANCIVYFLYELPYWYQGNEGIGPFGFVPNQPTASSLLLSMFAHGGFMHLALNMLFLWLFGSVVEDVLGPLMFLMFYLGGQLGATLLDVGMAESFDPASLRVPRVGASGAIAGILGLSAVCFPKVRVRVFYLVGLLLMWRAGTTRVQTWFFLGVCVFYELLGAVNSTAIGAATGEAVGGVAHWAHIGGFAVGMVGAMMLGLRGKIRRHDLLSERVYDADGEGYTRYADLDALVRRSPDDAAAWTAVARSKERFGFAAEAADAYGRAVTLFLRQRDTERAAQAYLSLLRNAPAFVFPAPTQFDIAVSLTRAGEYQAALSALDRLLQSDPNAPEAEVALVRAGELAEKLGEPRAALSYYNSLLTRFPYTTWRDYASQRMRALGK